MPEDYIPIVAILMVFGIPIIAILTSHQQKMARLFHENQAAANVVSPETQALREDIRELKALVHQQSIAIDNLTRPLQANDGVQQRVG